KAAWSIATVQGILDNDFYIGTLRQGKYTRKKINGAQTRRDIADHLVFENHHQPIIDYRTFATTMALREKRSRNNYRGIKINDNVYSGFLFCGDCGSPMFAMSRRDLKDAYRCGEYHKRGLSACTSHHIRVETLDMLIKNYVQKVRDNSEAILERLNEDIKKESEDLAETEKATENLEEILADLQEELKVTKRQRVRDIMKRPEQEQTLEEVYDELESDLVRKIEGLQNQLAMTQDKHNTIIRVNRAAKTAIEVFADILNKPKLERNDLELIISSVKVYEDHLEIQLQADIDSIIRSGKLPEREEAANFKSDIADSLQTQLVQSAFRHADKVYDVSVISDGDPLEIFTEKDGEVIFKKYSPVGELADFAAQICESLFKTGDCIAAVCDRDSVIACSGVPKKELADRRLSDELSDVLEARKLYSAEGPPEIPFVYGNSSLYVCVAAPILSEGDLIGGVIFAAKKESAAPTEVQIKLASTVASFLGKQMET
ncbi:MAG: stage V sporulation protein T, partial [Clostridiales bacterium]|nr:stage V sporulation protein T [Clostridiales bacterium]